MDFLVAVADSDVGATATSWLPRIRLNANALPRRVAIGAAEAVIERIILIHPECPDERRWNRDARTPMFTALSPVSRPSRPEKLEPDNQDAIA